MQGIYNYIPEANHVFLGYTLQLFCELYCKLEGKVIPVQAHYSRRGFQKSEALRFRESRHTKVIKLSAVDTGHSVDRRTMIRPEGLCQ